MSQEKRNYFRMQQDIQLEHQAVDAYTAKEGNLDDCFSGSESLQLFTQLRRIDQEAAPLLQAISNHSRETAEYLQLTNRKFELLAKQLISNCATAADAHPSKVNLSEGGIAFYAEKPAYKGSYIALRAIFLPSYNSITTFAQVIRCDTNKNQSYQIAAKFIRLNSAERETISREIMHAQLKSARAQKQA